MSARGRGFEIATRIGFVARALLYVAIGWLALRSGRAEDGPAILEDLAGGGGRLVVAAMALGFFGYGAWRLLEAWFDSEGRGAGAKAMAVRIGGAASGLIHLGFGVLATRLASGSRGSGDDPAEQGTATALSLPGGEVVVIVAATAILAAGFYQLVTAYRLRFLRRLDSRAAGTRWIAWLGRAGFLARGLVFLTIAWLLWRAARDGSSGEAGGIADALASLPEPVRYAVAAGLVLFGLFSLVEARFRRIDVPEPILR